MTYFQSIILGLIQGVSELFPISSLGHSVILPTLFGWTALVKAQSEPESYFLAFLVGLHVATATALLVFYRKDWKRIINGFFQTVKKRRIKESDERLAWLLIVATIPAGLTGLIFEHQLRVLFTKPLLAAVFLIINGLILWYGDRLLKKSTGRNDYSFSKTSLNIGLVRYRDAFIIGLAQVFALLAGISRSGITMVGGLWRGLDHEDAARFSFYLATPVILAAGILKLPDLLGTLGNGVRGQIFAGSVAAGIAAYFTVRYLDKYFRKNTLRPFAIYCILLGLGTILFIH